LVTETLCTPFAAQQIVEYAAAQKAAIGLLPTARRVVFERFFDETGGMQLVVHAPFGAAINRAWGLAFRKRFCRSFDFELQATADDDGFVLSLGPQHSFPIESLFPMLNLQNVRTLLEQAVLTVPMFQVRWRWNVTRSLLVLRQQNGKKVPPAFQRFRADDLLTAVFPRLTGCQEEQVGDIELPDHPLVNQTMHDCLHEALDFDGLQNVLSGIERGELTLIARDTREPSPFSDELLNANVYAFLDGGEIQERRARAVSTRRSFTVESVRDLGRLDPEAIEQVRREAQPLVRSADELHDTLLSRIVLPIAEPMAEPMADAADWEPWYRELAGQNRAATLTLPNGRKVWVTAERLPAALAVFPDAVLQPTISAPQSVRHDWTSTEARIAMVRGLIEICGPVTSEDIAGRLSFTGPQTSAALEALEGEGVVLRGQFTPRFNNDLPSPSEEADLNSAFRIPNSEIEWCHRRLLARIHRLTLQGLRRQIAPVGVDVFMRYLTRHHGLLASERRTGTNGVFEVVAMLQGLDFPAVSWERDILPARLDNYRPQFLDELCLTGEVGWGRLFPPKKNPDRSKPMASLTRVAPVSLVLRSDLAWLSASHPRFQPDNELRRSPDTSSPPSEGGARGGRTQACEDSPPVSGQLLSSPAREVFDLLSRHGAMFAADLMEETRMLPSQLDDVLGELVVRGLVTADGFAGLRKLIAEKSTSSHRKPRRTRSGVLRNRKSAGASGRWSVWQVPSAGEDETEQDDFVQQWAWQLLRRWGVVFRDLLTREAGAPRWFELLQVYRRLEARGEIRGGCFIAGVAGEQFALGDTVRQLRKLREDGPQQEFVVLCAADPLNLIGILTDHPRVPRTASNRVAYLDGVPLASLQAGDVGFYKDVPVELQRVLAERFGLSGSAMPRHALKVALTDLQ
jgi:ATP-dependent Lhr-like helicase